MKRGFFTGIFALGTMMVCSSGWAVTIEDNYWGGADYNPFISDSNIKKTYSATGDIVDRPTETGGVVIRTDRFDVSKMEVGIDDAGMVTVDIFTTFVNEPKIVNNDSLAQYYLGDLFISTDHWTPGGTAASNYANDFIAGGEDWEYALVLSGDKSGMGGDASLMRIDEKGKTSYSDPYYWGNSDGLRAGQEVSYSGGEGVGPLGHWSRNYNGTDSVDTDDYIRFTFNNYQDFFDIDKFALHWTMSCGNDVIEGGTAPVPEPATMLLFGTGLIGLAGIALRRKRK